MDWSTDAVLDYSARNHCRYLRGTKRLLLWPAWAWRVVAPEVKERKLNPLQRVVLRLNISGCRRYTDAGELLGLDPELVAYISQELVSMDLISSAGIPTERAARFLDETEIDVGDLRVGWVFQDALAGKLFPRFVTELPLATAEVGSGGYPDIIQGSKGNPFPARGFLVPGHDGFPIAPTPRDILDAGRRHRRHVKRHRRAQIDVGVQATKGLDQISLVSDRPERVHLLTFAYVPESESEEQPWYVAEPFGFGASEELRDQLEAMRKRASGTFRDMLDGITGAALDQHREHWGQMQVLLRDDARTRADEALPRGDFAADEPVRRALEEAYLELGRLEQISQTGRIFERDLDTAYLRLRQAIEAALELAHRQHPPGDAWRRIQGLPRNASRALIRTCAEVVGFDASTVPSAVQNAKWGQLRWVCEQEPSGRVRPTLAAFLLAATDSQDHPLRTVAAAHPNWLVDVDYVAEAAGGQVHAASKGQRRDITTIQDDMKVCVAALRSLLTALGSVHGGAHHG